MSPAARDEGHGGRAAERGEHEELPGLQAVRSRSAASGFSRTLSVEVSELIVDALVECRRRAAGAALAASSALRVHFTAAKPIATAPVAPTRYGNSHASRLKPLSIGAPSISSLPYFVDERLDDLVVVLALVDQRRELAAHLDATSRTDPSGTRRCWRGRTRRRCRRFRAASASRTSLRA